MYAIGGTVYIGCALIYLVFGTGQVQDFNEIKEETE